MSDVAMPATWDDLLAEIDEQIDRDGFWGQEARVLRDAAGLHRFGKANRARVLAALAEAGLECDPSDLTYESDTVLIQRTGAAELMATIADLLPAIREADRVVPRDAMWRDAIVARTAVGAWRRRG